MKKKDLHLEVNRVASTLVWEEYNVQWGRPQTHLQ